MGAKVMTANSLRDGDVVYLTATGTWTPWLHDSEVVHDKDGETRLELGAERAVTDREIVGPYLMDVADEDGVPRPLGTREKIRAKGPTTHPQFGKQAMNDADRTNGVK